MANLAQSAVTKTEIYYEGGNQGRRHKVVDVTLVLTGQGGTTNKILAALFGMTAIRRAHSFRDSTENIIVASPSYDGTYLTLKAAATAAPADVTATVKGVVLGIE
jgi:hypothetical protein